jgi:uncharacterized protein YdhG (YjbR/CyaY superfamily)
VTLITVSRKLSVSAPHPADRKLPRLCQRTGQESRSTRPKSGSRVSVQDSQPNRAKQEILIMSVKNDADRHTGFSEEERAAMKARAAELKAEGKKGAKKADGLQAVLDAIAKMGPEDRALAERMHVTITANAPQLEPRTWYGMPSYANEDGKIVVCFKHAGKFNARYSTLEFQDAAQLDDGEIWPVSFALNTWSPVVEQKVAELIKTAAS